MHPLHLLCAALAAWASPSGRLQAASTRYGLPSGNVVTATGKIARPSRADFPSKPFGGTACCVTLADCAGPVTGTQSMARQARARITRNPLEAPLRSRLENVLGVIAHRAKAFSGCAHPGLPRSGLDWQLA